MELRTLSFKNACRIEGSLLRRECEQCHRLKQTFQYKIILETNPLNCCFVDLCRECSELLGRIE